MDRSHPGHPPCNVSEDEFWGEVVYGLKISISPQSYVAISASAQLAGEKRKPNRLHLSLKREAMHWCRRPKRVCKRFNRRC